MLSFSNPSGEIFLANLQSIKDRYDTTQQRLSSGLKVVNASDAPERGITPSPEDSFSPTNTSTHAFDMAFLKIDSDQALAVALKHGGDKLMVKDADQPVLYRLNWATAENMLVWHVMFGASSSEVKLNVIVNASTGDFVRAE